MGRFYDEDYYDKMDEDYFNKLEGKSSSYSSGISKNDELVLGGFFFTMMATSLVLFVILAIAQWKIFTKAGEEGWKSIIPFYNTYIVFKISWDVKYFWIFIGICVVEIVISFILPFISLFIIFFLNIYLLYLGIRLNYLLARSFEQGIGFTIGLILLSPIFYLILGFSKSIVYIGNTTTGETKNTKNNFNSTVV